MCACLGGRVLLLGNSAKVETVLMQMWERVCAAAVAHQGAQHRGPLPPQGCRLRQPVYGGVMADAAAAQCCCPVLLPSAAAQWCCPVVLPSAGSVSVVGGGGGEALEHKELAALDDLLGGLPILNHTPPHLQGRRGQGRRRKGWVAGAASAGNLQTA